VLVVCCSFTAPALSQHLPSSLIAPQPKVALNVFLFSVPSRLFFSCLYRSHATAPLEDHLCLTSSNHFIVMIAPSLLRFFPFRATSRANGVVFQFCITQGVPPRPFFPSQLPPLSPKATPYYSDEFVSAFFPSFLCTNHVPCDHYVTVIPPLGMLRPWERLSVFVRVLTTSVIHPFHFFNFFFPSAFSSSTFILLILFSFSPYPRINVCCFSFLHLMILPFTPRSVGPFLMGRGAF